jgi:hypothetical protein
MTLDRTTKGVFLGLASFAVFSFSDACVKQIKGQLPPYESAFYNGGRHITADRASVYERLIALGTGPGHIRWCRIGGWLFQSLPDNI